LKIDRTFAGVMLALSLVAVAGCGSSGSSASDTTAASSGATTTAPTAEPGGKPDGKSVDVCKKITADEVSAIVGGAVTSEAIPGGGCRFPQDDVRAPTAAFDSSSSSVASGTYDSAKYGVTATIKGDVKDVDGVGDKAFVVIGTSPGGTMPQGGGLVQVGPTLVQVTLIEGSDMSKGDVETMTTKLLELAAAKG
jgi:hypothetical protein